MTGLLSLLSPPVTLHTITIRYQKNRLPIKYMLAVTLVRYVAVLTANMNLIGERFFYYRYRVQCDRQLSLPAMRALQMVLGTR